MKRALLKMGKHIKVVSRTATRYFEIVIDVEEWMNEPDWTFQFSKVKDERARPSEIGTSITVTGLYPGVAEQFGLKQFNVNLALAIEQKQAIPMLEGFTIKLNGEPLNGALLLLRQSKDIAPIHVELPLVNEKSEQCRLQVFAGIDEPDNDRAGWYVICNGRTVLRADRTALTGWGNKYDGDRIPSYHHQYARFRGFVMFQSEKPDSLPWNTAKSGVDVEHAFYRRALQLMLQAMKDVFGFLNRVDRESDAAERPLSEAIGKMKAVPLKKVALSKSFVVKVKSTPVADKTATKLIRYRRPAEQVEGVMAALGVEDPNQAGEGTFDLYYQLNVAE